MANGNESVADEVVITRFYGVPREVVFRAWSEAGALEKWYAPKGCTLKLKRFEFRVGGKFHSVIRTSTGFECWCVGEYREIVAGEKIVYTLAIADQHGERIDPAAAGHDAVWPGETVVTVTFTRRGTGTELRLHQTVSAAIAKKTGAYPGWMEMLEGLGVFVGADG